MGTLLLDQIKKQASYYLQEKYKSARLAFTDVTQAELLAEEATNSSTPCSPDAKTMTKIAEASFEIDDYWRIVDVLHRRLYMVDWKEWRQYYKTLVLLEFLLTHGPEEFAEEFQSDAYVIQELGTFRYIDQNGFNWGAHMQIKSNAIIKLLLGGQTLRDARLKALRITNEIQGFGNDSIPSSNSNSMNGSPSSSSNSSRDSSFGSFSTTSSIWNDIIIPINNYDHHQIITNNNIKDDQQLITVMPIQEEEGNIGIKDHDEEGNKQHLWEYCPQFEEKGFLLEAGREDDDHDVEALDHKSTYITSSPSNKYDVDAVQKISLIRSVSDVGKRLKKKFDRQFSSKNN